MSQSRDMSGGDQPHGGSALQSLESNTVTIMTRKCEGRPGSRGQYASPSGTLAWPHTATTRLLVAVRR